MAQTKKKAITIPNKEAVKKNEDRVVKRPARGFHRFRNGILNVAPKGGEKELVKSNQNSPLLRLPPELRYRIWTLVIGVPILRTPLRTTPEDKRVQPLKLPITEGKKAWALLRTCRQIYAETALLPYKSSIFSDTLRTPLKSQLKCLKTFQRAQIEDLQVEVMLPGHTRSPHLSGLRRVKLDILPGLKRIRVLAFRHVNCSETKIEECRTATRSELDLLLAGTNISFMFEVIEMSWIDYDKKWYRSRQ